MRKKLTATDHILIKLRNAANLLIGGSLFIGWMLGFASIWVIGFFALFGLGYLISLC